MLLQTIHITTVHVSVIDSSPQTLIISVKIQNLHIDIAYSCHVSVDAFDDKEKFLYEYGEGYGVDETDPFLFATPPVGENKYTPIKLINTPANDNKYM